MDQVFSNMEYWGLDPRRITYCLLTHPHGDHAGGGHILKQRGVRVLPGGDYGFAWNPIGNDARDLEHFTNYLGFTPMEAIVSATRYGGEIMMMGNELGQVKEGYLADLLLVAGDPLKDVSILQDQDNLLGIMKDGSFHKRPDPEALSASQAA